MIPECRLPFAATAKKDPLRIGALLAVATLMTASGVRTWAQPPVAEKSAGTGSKAGTSKTAPAAASPTAKAGGTAPGNTARKTPDAGTRAFDLRALEGNLKRMSLVWRRVDALQTFTTKHGPFTAAEAGKIVTALAPAGRPAEEHFLIKAKIGGEVARVLESRLTNAQKTAMQGLARRAPATLPTPLKKAPPVEVARGGRGTNAAFDVAAVLSKRNLTGPSQYAEAGRKFDLAIAYSQGLGTPKDPAQAAVLLREAIQGGLGTKSGASKPGKGSRETAGVSHYTAARFKSVMGAYWHAVDLEKAGRRNEAINWFRASAQGGGFHAQDTLARKLLFNGELDAGSFEEIFGWLTRAAKYGFPEAMYVIGVAIHSGLGVPRDVTLGRQWLEAGVKAGSESAATAIAQLNKTSEETSRMLAALNRSNAASAEAARKFGEAMKNFNDAVDKSQVTSEKKPAPPKTKE